MYNVYLCIISVYVYMHLTNDGTFYIILSHIRIQCQFIVVSTCNANITLLVDPSHQDTHYIKMWHRLITLLTQYACLRA